MLAHTSVRSQPLTEDLRLFRLAAPTRTAVAAAEGINFDVPVVVLRGVTGPHASTVVIDQDAGSRLATRHLHCD